MLDIPIGETRVAWESTSFDILERMTDKDAVAAERAYVADYDNFNTYPQYHANFPNIYYIYDSIKYVYSVGIIREEGSNGDREMAFAFYDSGFNVHDINMNDLVKKFGGFAEDMNSLGNSIATTQRKFDAAKGKLIDGRGSVSSRINKLVDLGSKEHEIIEND